VLPVNEYVVGLFETSVERKTNNFDKNTKFISKYEDLYEISVLVLKIISIRNTNILK
jgi:hypothetical protein